MSGCSTAHRELTAQCGLQPRPCWRALIAESRGAVTNLAAETMSPPAPQRHGRSQPQNQLSLPPRPGPAQPLVGGRQRHAAARRARQVALRGPGRARTRPRASGPPRPPPTATDSMPTGPPPKVSITHGEHAPVHRVEAARVDLQPRERASRRCARSSRPSPSTCAKSRARCRSRSAMRGVPRARRASSAAPVRLHRQPELAGGAHDDGLQIVRGRSSRAAPGWESGRAAATASRPVRVVAPTSVKRSSFISMVWAPRPAPSTTSNR